MAGCAPTSQSIRRVCLGDMRHKIEIQSRSITPPPGSDIKFGENFVTTKTVWAYLKTVRGVSIFDGTNIAKAITDKFVIRYIATLTEESWVKYRSNLYNILDIEDYDGRKQFMVLSCNLRGDQGKPVNYA